MIERRQRHQQSKQGRITETERKKETKEKLTKKKKEGFHLPYSRYTNFHVLLFLKI
jgi:hypothetical protein